jgi:hypothetical protein
LTASAPRPASAGPFFTRSCIPYPSIRGKRQQNGVSSGSLDECADRGTVQPDDESGSPGALLRRGPLRTARAAFTAGSSSKPGGGAGCSCVPRRREDPLPQPPYVVLMGAPVDGVPHQGVVRRSVHHEVSNLPSDSDGLTSIRFTAHLPTSASLSGPGHHGPVSGQLPATATWRSGHGRRGFLSAFAHRHSLLGHPVPASGIPPLSRLAYRATAAARTLSGFPRSARVRHDRGGCLLYSGAAVSSRPPRPR